MDFHMVFFCIFSVPSYKAQKDPLFWGLPDLTIDQISHTQFANSIMPIHPVWMDFYYFCILDCAGYMPLCLAAQLARPKFLNEIGLFPPLVEEFGRAKIFKWAVVHGHNGLYLAPS
jgi:hypothetical protein